MLGITWFAQDALGELVHFEAPEAGSTVTKDEAYGEVESVKAVSDVIAPLSGEILEVNAEGDRRAGDRQRRPVRRGLADPDPAHRPGRGRRACSTPRPTGALASTRAVSYLSLTDARPRGDARGDRRLLGRRAVRRSPPRRALRARARRAARTGRGGADAAPRGARRQATRTPASSSRSSAPGIYDHYVPAVVDVCCRAASS